MLKLLLTDILRCWLTTLKLKWTMVGDKHFIYKKKKEKEKEKEIMKVVRESRSTNKKGETKSLYMYGMRKKVGADSK